MLYHFQNFPIYMRSKTESNFTGQPRGKLNSVSHQENIQQETVERKCNVRWKGKKKHREKKKKYIHRHSSHFPVVKRTLKWQIQICANEPKLSDFRRPTYAISVPRRSDSREIRPKGEQLTTGKRINRWFIFSHCLIDKGFNFVFLLLYFAFSRYGYIYLEKRAEFHESENVQSEDDEMHVQYGTIR